MYAILVKLASFIFFILFRYKFIGRENLPKGGPLLICPNHTKAADPLYVAFAVGSERMNFMAKQSLFEIPVLGRILLWIGCIPVKRDGNDLAAMKAGTQAIRQGKKLLIFPEGRRVHKGETEKALGGAGVFALRYQVPVLPVYICRPKGRALRRVVITFGKPVSFSFEGKPTREDYERVADEIMQAVFALKDESAQ